MSQHNSILHTDIDLGRSIREIQEGLYADNMGRIENCVTGSKADTDVGRKR